MDQVQEVKDKTDIVALIDQNVKLTKAGTNFRGLCPFHDEKTPSFMVSPELQIFKCFGCGESGDAITFLQKYENLEFYEALKDLADKAGVKLKRQFRPEDSDKEKLLQANDLAAKFYHYILLNHPSGSLGLDYLKVKRGIKLSTIKTFNLGFAPEKPGALYQFLRTKKNIKPEIIEKAGLIIKIRGRFIDRFRGRVIFPITDHRGQTIALGGRILPEIEAKLPKGRHVGKYINSPETPIYHKSRNLYGLGLTKDFIKKKKSAVLVEGETDLLTPFQIGVKNIVAIKGSALTKEQATIISRFTKETILALDSDAAGEKAAIKAFAQASEIGLTVKVVSMGDYKDPDEFARQKPKKFLSALKKPTDYYDFVISTIFKKYDSQTGSGKSSISREVVPILSSISDQIVKSHYIKLVADKLNVSVETVLQEVNKIKSPSLIPDSTVNKSPSIKPRRELLEEELLATCLLINPKKLINKNIQSLISTPLAKKILDQLVKFTKTKKFDPKSFTNSLPDELKTGFNNLYFKLSEIKDDTNAKDLNMLIFELKILDLKQKLNKTTSLIKKYEQEENTKLLKKAQQKFQKISAELANLASDSV